MDNKIIFENWRQWLSSLTKQGSKSATEPTIKPQTTPTDFAAKVSARAEKILDNTVIVVYQNDNTAYIYYATLVDNEEISFNTDPSTRWVKKEAQKELDADTSSDVSRTDLPWGVIKLRQTDYKGPCHGGWTIKATEAKKGWGPLLYDIAIEFATEKGSGLIPDRSSVSSAALKVWQSYLTKRSDVESAQLDDQDDTLTPGKEKDNCDQKSAVAHKGKNWTQSPLSKIYGKKPTMMNQLRSKSKLVIKGN